MKRYITSSESDVQLHNEAVLGAVDEIAQQLESDISGLATRFVYMSDTVPISPNNIQLMLIYRGRYLNPDHVTIPNVFNVDYDKIKSKVEKLIEKQTNSMIKSPKRYVYEICRYLGWRPPMFIDTAAGGYRLRYLDDSLEEAEDTVAAIQHAADELGIDLVRAYTKEYGGGKWYAYVVVPANYKQM